MSQALAEDWSQKAFNFPVSSNDHGLIFNGFSNMNVCEMLILLVSGFLTLILLVLFKSCNSQTYTQDRVIACDTTHLSSHLTHWLNEKTNVVRFQRG